MDIVGESQQGPQNRGYGQEDEIAADQPASQVCVFQRKPQPSRGYRRLPHALELRPENLIRQRRRGQGGRLVRHAPCPALRTHDWPVSPLIRRERADDHPPTRPS